MDPYFNCFNIFHSDKTKENIVHQLYNLDNKIDEYLNAINNLVEVDALKWWKSNQFRFLIIADLARNLGAQATSAGLKIMFSIDCNIFAEKRRKLGHFRIW
jgi:hypothetical protein